MAEHRLLLVEDDYDVAEMLTAYFGTHRYTVFHADDGATGIELARTCLPSLILLDVMLPDMDGYDVCARLRRTTMTKYIPILFLTQKDGRANKVRGLELGVDDYITKPFDVDELRLRVQRSLRRATGENLHEARTGLPTGAILNEVIAQKLAEAAPFLILSYQIVGFQTYHDVYGFVAAKEALHRAGKIIQEKIGELGTVNDFIGIMDDEFIVLTHAEDVDTLDNAIKRNFAQEAHAFYTFADAERDGILLNPGTSEERLIPLMQLFSQIKSLSGAQ